MSMTDGHNGGGHNGGINSDSNHGGKGGHKDLHNERGTPPLLRAQRRQGADSPAGKKRLTA